MQIGEYQAIELVGEGGQARVFKVADPSIPDKMWALKLFNAQSTFEVEKDTLRALETLYVPAIPRLANAFSWNQQYALVTTFFPGRTLKGMKKEWRWVHAALLEVADVLTAIHRCGYLYLDLKPENLVLGSDGRKYLIDYALSQPRSGARSVGMGSPGFASPEQISRGAALTTAADAYSLGALGFYLLTGSSVDPHSLPRLASVPVGLELLLRRLVMIEAGERPDLSSFSTYTLESASAELRQCPKCSTESRVEVEVCPNCGARLIAAKILAPSFENRSRVLPPTVVSPPTSASNAVLQEVAKPSLARYPFNRVLRLQAEGIAQIRGFQDLRAPMHLKARITFYEHQIDAGTRALQEMRGNAILADEVGLGKTIEAGLIVKELILRTLVQRVLVLTPPHLVDQWVVEMEEKFDLKFHPYDGPSSWGSPLLVASTRALARKSNAKIVEQLPRPYDLIVVDEMHNLLKKTGEPNGTYESLKGLARKYTLLLSATPIRHHIKELYYLVNLVSPGTFPMSVTRFLERFERFGRRADLRTELERVMIRHRRSSLPPEALPPRREVLHKQLIPADYETELLVQAEALLRQQRHASEHELSQAYSSIASQSRLLGAQLGNRTCNKLAETIEILTSIGDQAVVFTRESSTGDYITRHLGLAGFKVIFLGPGLSHRQKAEKFYEFKRQPRSVLVATDIAAEGRNLQFAHHLVNFDVPWNPLRLEQRMGRIDRLGQKRTPTIHNLYYADTFEGDVYGLFDRGLRMFDLIIGELTSVLAEAEEFADEPLDMMLSEIWRRHSHDRTRVGRELGLLSGRLSAVRAEFDTGKRESDQLDRELF